MGYLSSIRQNIRGSFSIVISLGAVVLIGGIGIGIDVARLNQQRAVIQTAVDAAALASAYEMGLASTDENDIEAVAIQYIQLNFADISVSPVESDEGITINVAVASDRKKVTVDLAYVWRPLFAHLVSDTVTPIRASATASLAGDQSICVVALDPENNRSLYFSGASTIRTNDCGVYANSTSEAGLEINASGAFLDATSTYISGGYLGDNDNFNAMPITDSPPIQDPLRARALPSIDVCEPQNTELFFSPGAARRDARFKNDVLTLLPGTYCGGLSVTGKVEVQFEPGIYVFLDGKVEIKGNATIRGENVGMFFSGAASTFEFTGSSQVDLTAPEEGPMAGILFFEDRDAPLNRDFIIETKDAERFEGTVYLSRGRFVIDKESRLGQQSNWTAIIAHQIETGTGPELEINSDYAASTIPVPEGIAPASGQAILTDRR